jgi:hypothetical protein
LTPTISPLIRLLPSRPEDGWEDNVPDADLEDKAEWEVVIAVELEDNAEWKDEAPTVE